VNPVSAMMARRMIKVPHVAMVNLLAGRMIVPELLQEDCNPATLAKTVLGLIRDGNAAEAQRQASQLAVATLRPPGGNPSAAAALAVTELMQSSTAASPSPVLHGRGPG
jgi:lipid-A-disaccharide synthase